MADLKLSAWISNSLISNASSSDRASSELIKFLDKTVAKHRSILNNSTPDFKTSQPLIIYRMSNSNVTDNSSAVYDLAIQSRFKELNTQLIELGSADAFEEDRVEAGAVDSAREVLAKIQSNSLPPPSISWLDVDAIAMIWVRSRDKYALTVTEGEVGFVVHRDGRTVRRVTNVPLQDFKPLQIENVNELPGK